MDADFYLHWIALGLTPGLGARMAGKLLAEFGSPEAVFSASLTALEAQRLPAAVAQALHSRRPLSEAAKELAKAQAIGCRLLTWDEPEYPVRLREIYDPPPFSMSKERLSFWGAISSLSSARDVQALTGIKWQRGWDAI